MLVLSRKTNQSIIIGDSIEIRVVDIKGDQVKFGISAPRSVTIYRKEVYEEIQKENRAAAELDKSAVEGLKEFLGKDKSGKKGGFFKLGLGEFRSKKSSKDADGSDKK